MCSWNALCRSAGFRRLFERELDTGRVGLHGRPVQVWFIITNVMKIHVVIEVKDANAFTVHPIEGRSGKIHGTALYCPVRGCMACRLTMEEWREAREDICTARHRFYPFVFDVEVSEDSDSAAVAELREPALVAVVKKTQSSKRVKSGK